MSQVVVGAVVVVVVIVVAAVVVAVVAVVVLEFLSFLLMAPGFKFRHSQEIPFPKMSTPNLRPNQPPIQRVSGSFPWG